MKSKRSEGCPVNERFLERLYRASPEGLPVLIRTVPPQTRAAIAVHLSGQEHLQWRAFVIAACCDEFDLYNQAGQAGIDLKRKAQQMCVVDTGRPEPIRPAATDTQGLSSATARAAVDAIGSIA